MLRIFSLSILIIGVFTPFKIFATYGVDEPYPSGNTLDPVCAPGSSFCTVVLSSGSLTLNGLTGINQTFSIGNSGTDFNIDSTGTIHTFNFPDSSATSRGLLTSADWNTFNNKQSTLSQASTSSNGYLSLGDWNTFNSKLSSESDPLSLKLSNNLSDLTNVSNARNNLVLGNVENVALSSWPGSSNLTTLGTIISGIWNGTTIDIANGGTGATSAYGARLSLSAAQSGNNSDINSINPSGALTMTSGVGSALTLDSGTTGNLNIGTGLN